MSAAAPAAVLVRGARPPAAWHELLRAAADVSFFHEEAWAAAVAAHIPGCEGAWLLVRDGERPLGGWALARMRRGPAHRWQAHYAGTAAGPLLAGDLAPPQRERVLDALLDGLADLAAAVGCVGTTLHLPPRWDAALGARLSARGFIRRDDPAAVLPLAGGIDHVEMHVFKKNRRNERNRAFKAGVTAEVHADDRHLAAFHALYRRACAGWGVAPVPEIFCRDLLRDAGGKAFLVTAHREGEVLGGHLCLRDGEQVTAWLGATAPERNDLFPATVLVWTDLQEACRRGAARLDLGGHGGQEGVRNFKKLLGADTLVRGCWERAPAAARLLRAAARWRRRGRP